MDPDAPRPELGGDVEALAAFVRHPGEGEARWWLGSLSVILASSRETAGKFTLIDVTDPECGSLGLAIMYGTALFV